MLRPVTECQDMQREMLTTHTHGYVRTLRYREAVFTQTHSRINAIGKIRRFSGHFRRRLINKDSISTVYSS